MLFLEISSRMHANRQVAATIGYYYHYVSVQRAFLRALLVEVAPQVDLPHRRHEKRAHEHRAGDQRAVEGRRCARGGHQDDQAAQVQHPADQPGALVARIGDLCAVCDGEG